MKQEAENRTNLLNYYLLLGVTITLVLFGTIMIFSASQIVAFDQTKDSYYYLKKHVVAILLGLTGLFIFSRVDYSWLKKVAVFLFGGAVVLLVLVLVPGIGKMAGGSRSWLALGFFNFQPSEFAKLALLIFAASVLSHPKKDLRYAREVVVPLVPACIVLFALVVAQPDLGGASILVAMLFAVLFIAGARKRHLFTPVLAAVSGGALIVATQPYMLNRIHGFLDPWSDPWGKGFHIIQAMMALGSGGLGGVGLGMSRQKFFYLPAGHTDFILAIVGEELGLGGSLFVILMFLILAYLGIRICLQAKDEFAKILAGGIVTLIMFQAIINMGVAVALLPVTGITLPLLSFGGSSLVFTLVEIGILLNIAAQGKEPRARVYHESHNMRRGNRRAHLPRTSAGRRVAFHGKS